MLSSKKAEIYSMDASRVAGKAVDVLFPESEEEVLEIVNTALEKGWKITPRGAGTSLTGSAVPLDSIVVDLSRLKGIIELSENSATVYAGTTLAEVMCAAAGIGMLFPVKPASYRVATVGGAIATNAAGFRAKIFGRMENWVKKLWFVDGTGKLRKISGRRAKLFCGSEGSFGIVTRVELGLTELPEVVSSDVFTFDSYSKLSDFLIEKANEQDVSAVEIANDTFFELTDGESKIEVIVEYFSDRGKIRGAEYEALWKRREGYAPLIFKLGYTFIEDPRLPVEHVASFMEWLSDLGIPAFSHGAVGIVHPFFKDLAVAGRVLQRALELGGTITGEHGYGIIKAEFFQNRNYETLKRIYDPYNIFNSGPRKVEYVIKTTNCTFCGLCRYYCPVFGVYPLEEYSPRAKANFLKKYPEISLLCTLCKACEVNCPVEYGVTEKILEARRKLKEKLLSNDRIKEMVDNVLTTGNVFGNKPPKREKLFCC